MSSKRKHRLIECNPRWVEDSSGLVCYLRFDCPEGREGCWHSIPFTPALNGKQWFSSMAQWQRTGITFETLTLTPSIARTSFYKSREEAIADGCIPEHVTERLLCALHVNLIDGTFHFADDSR